MAVAARLAQLESLLRDKKLDRTLSTALPPLVQAPDRLVASGVDAVDAALTGGNYEVLRQRLATAGQELARRAEALNARRKAVFGTTEPQLVATERLRTEHNCAPVDIVAVGETLLLGYQVFLGLKAETKASDVLALHRFEPLPAASKASESRGALASRTILYRPPSRTMDRPFICKMRSRML